MRQTRIISALAAACLAQGAGTAAARTSMGAAEMLATQSAFPADQIKLRYHDVRHMGFSVAVTARAMTDDLRLVAEEPRP